MSKTVIVKELNDQELKITYRGPGEYSTQEFTDQYDSEEEYAKVRANFMERRKEVIVERKKLVKEGLLSKAEAKSEPIQIEVELSDEEFKQIFEQ